MTVEEGNKNIAEFEGWKHDDWGIWYRPKDGVHFSDSDLKYHTSWDWLMPVVEKIEGLDLGVTVVIKENKCGIYRYKGSAYEYLIEKIETETKIAATYLAILKFIEWYNQNK